LIEAVEAYDKYSDALEPVGYVARGENWSVDQKQFDEVMQLTLDAWYGVTKLAPRAKIARLNLLWREFLKKKEGR
jgi:hypothetical protein